jgi:acetyl-CoA acetyltransferase
MGWVHQDKTAIVGIGTTDYYRRGESWPRTINDMAGEAILKACADAGISITDVDGIAYYSGAGAGYVDKFDTASLMETLGIPYVGFTASLTSGGGGAAGAAGLATAGLMNEDCTYCITVMALQQLPQHRLGVVFGASAPSPENSFLQPSGLVGPGHLMSVLARRHMHLYGTTREAFKEVVQATRQHAVNRPKAVRRNELSDEEYWNQPMLADPLCRLDFCLETDGAVAFVTTTSDRAKDCRHPPALIHGCAHGGTRNWGRAFAWMGMQDPDFASSGHKFVADRLWEQTGLKAQDMDVALIYDHFSAMVLMQLEDYGFCEKGEGNDFVLDGNIRFESRHRKGAVPVNTHGGNLNEAYIIGLTHVIEAVEQVRGTTINQVEDCEFALSTGGPASLPVSGLILRRA